jgi:hypothetical protein
MGGQKITAIDDEDDGDNEKKVLSYTSEAINSS